MIPYHTFDIDPSTLQIYRNSREYFTAHHQRSWTLEQAKATIDQSIDAKDAMDKLPDLGKAFRVFAAELENRAEEMEREAERVNDYYALEQEPDLNNR